MFTVYHSNQIDILKSLLVELIRLNPLDNPFEKEQILVQSPGMSQWLKMELAKELGVAANIDFPLPATFIWDMFTHVLPDVPKRSAFNKESMTWKIMHILPSLLKLDDFSPLQQYLDNDTDDTKLYQLSEKIADIFDGYLVYRPEWIASWEAGEVVSELEGEHSWQPILWQALYDYTVAQDQSPYHRANLYEHFIETIGHFIEGHFEHLPERLFVFGITSLPPRYMDALKSMGDHIDVHLMFTNPCRYYWGEVRDKRYLARLAAKHRQHLVWQEGHSELQGETEQLKGNLVEHLQAMPEQESELHTDVVGNSLLASMGKLGRDNLFLLSQLESHEIEAFVDISTDNLLHQLQADILNLEEHQDDSVLATSEHKPVITPADGSLSLHACHSPMREVEVLHDRLLAMFDADPSLKPRDVIVMVADINAYSPAIQAVFGNAPGERYIPYSISDRSADQESPILAAFMQLVNLPNLRCLATELLELLETPAMMAKFELDDRQFEQVKQWVEESGVRWGVNASTATEFDLPATEQNTWLFGIQRMLLGYAMPDSAGLFSNQDSTIAPYNEVQGMGAELAGKLAHFIERIDYYRQALNRTQSIDEWREVLQGVLDDFFSVDLDGELVLKSIRDGLTQLKEQLIDAGFKQDLSPSIVRQYLQNRLSGTRISQRFLAGQVNFCTLMPMRSIPFKTVCLLGMNDGVYPRSMPPEGFDLMNGRTKPGDRSRRDDDRYLFLEALLSAQQSLYISYVGRSIQDNTERGPSVLVAELLEYCHQNYRLAGDELLPVDASGDRVIEALVQHHPMVPFSASAFSTQPDAGKSSYAKEWLPAVNRLGQCSPNFYHQLSDYLLDVTYPLSLDLVELQRFWRLPVQYFFNRRLKVDFDPLLSSAENDEPFALNGLEGYTLRNQLLDKLLASAVDSQNSSQQVVETFIQQQRAQGKLPVGAFGEIEFATNRTQAEQLVEKLVFICSSELEDVEVNITIDALGEGKPIVLTGWLTHHYQSGLVRYRSGKLRSQDYLAAWIDHLCLAVMGQGKITHMVGYDKKEGVQHIIYPVIEDVDLAKQQLSDLATLFYQGMSQPLAYFPKTALAGVEAGFSRGKWVDDEEKALKKMEATFNDGYQFAGEGSNSYIARIWPQWNEELAAQARQLSTLIMQAPRLQSLDSEDR
ncbi:exodeoxyribonuclease V subunit gamma [Vibrio sp. 10N.286.49.B3]|uniref:exodeoxyribonuclease V subunit gamma n=1 Tax=Vibrio sp. 10N.286.49.B3 TaxID=1880855 RepID=UPI000C83DCF8|nr:exodeoxyribonuclease V subunit gamma [Vibrio sp. 10N.286.49.B3]PMH41161.1 exodeoxyribonuclease V subunit gamma [Vibrio sp. 10N.286.49.B3]